MNLQYSKDFLKPCLVEGMVRNVYEFVTCVGPAEIEGSFEQMNKEYNMIFAYFILRQGRLIAKGKDRFYGEFAMMGSYDNEGNICFVKKVNDQNFEFEFQGHVRKINEENDFEIKGQWKDIEGDSNGFQIKGKIKNDEKVEHEIHLKVDTLLENGKALGYYDHQIDNQRFEIVLDQFSLKKGNVSGKGIDNMGEFTVSGFYDNNLDIAFVKQYIEQHSVSCVGKIKRVSSSEMEINGNWEIDNMLDEFHLKIKTSETHIGIKEA